MVIKKTRPPEKDDEKLLFWDWQNQLEMLGSGILTNYRGSGNTFLPTAEESRKVPKVYRYDLWMVKIKSLTDLGEEKGYNVNTEYLFKIPYLVGTGHKHLQESDDTIVKNNSLRPDNFLKVNGKSIY